MSSCFKSKQNISTEKNRKNTRFDNHDYKSATLSEIKNITEMNQLQFLSNASKESHQVKME